MSIRILITMEGGLIQSIASSDPDETDIIIADFDTEGLPESETVFSPEDKAQYTSGRLNAGAIAELSPEDDAFWSRHEAKYEG